MDTWTNCRGYIMQSNGVQYVGDFVGNIPDGQGTVTLSAPHPEAGQKQVGEFREGKLHKGTATWSAPHRLAGEKHVGEFREGKLHKGTLTFSAPHRSAGEKQVGEFREGKLHGQGTLTFSAPHQSAGVKYVGEVRDRNPHGQGTKTFSAPHRKAGEEKVGIWEQNVLMTGTRTFVTPHERTGEKEIWKTGSLLKTIYPSKSEPVTVRPEPEKSQEAPLEKYESKCLNLGFTKGTEKFGDCVMKLMDRL